MIVAMDKRRAIAKSGKIPWYLSDDLKHFKKTTIGKTVVTGRKNYETIIEALGEPLKDRSMIVLTRNQDFTAPGCLVIDSLTHLLYVYRHWELFIIGGGEIYSLFLPHTHRLIVTHVETIADGDVFFPEITNDWKATEILRHEADEKNEFPFRIVEYTR